MTARTVLIGVSQRTFVESPMEADNLRFVPVSVAEASVPSDGDCEDFVEVLWRRQWDRTAWCTGLIESLVGLRWVHTDTAGVDRMPLARLLERKISLTNAKGVHTSAVAEWAVGAMLLSARRLTQTILNAVDHSWRPHSDDLLLQGRGVLILGLGDIGCYLANLCAALGMRVLGVSRSGLPRPGVERVLCVDDDWQALLPDCAFLVNCLPATPRTEGLVDSSVLCRMPTMSFFINVGRGETVVEEDVIAAVELGRIRGAVLDSVRQEPLPPTSSLWNPPGVIVSPHASGFTDQTESRTRALFAEQVRRYVRGDGLMNVIDCERGY